MSACPVVFLAFANDLGDYLYQLTEEQNAIRNALRPMVKQGLCEVVYETDTDLNKIWRTFDEYRDRIAIFHYGGHADDYSLLLKKANGEQQLVDGEGLVSFLGRQKGLQLVFINGCSSKRQAEELRDKGVPAVVGTSEPIDDAAATTLSRTFYESLAAGRSIEQAWLGAKDMILSDKRKKQSGFNRGIKLEGGAGGKFTKEFPWELYIRPGAETVKDWNLPQAARSPLFGLPLPEAAFRRLPDAPYVGLHYFQEEDAAIFYGRGGQIRELYNHIKGIHPIILLYGKSGVGKSSMLDAGLLPRIKDQYQIIYLRRKQEKGLLGTLEEALEELLGRQEDVAEPVDPELEQAKADLDMLRQAAGHLNNRQIREEFESLLRKIEKWSDQETVSLSGILKKWYDIERNGKRPLIVILDQVEEKFTRPMPGIASGRPDEFLTFLMAIQPLFSGKNSGIAGKIILSYRKEYHPEIRDAFQSLTLPYAEVFLKRLDRDGIIEAIRGCTIYDRLDNGKIHYNLTYNPYRLELEQSERGNLAEIIADDLMEDPESPIAPVLQIIMKKLWETAPKTDGEPVRLTVRQYQELRKEGTSMGEFFQQQMQKLRTANSNGRGQKYRKELQQAVASGLVLDLLYAHTTDKGTAGSCTRTDLLQRYDLPQPLLINLLEQLQDLSLLNQAKIRKKSSNEEAFTTYLAHDTLAPVVIREFNTSDAPGQRAARTLNNEMTKLGYKFPPQLLGELESNHQAYQLRIEDLPLLEKECLGLKKFIQFTQQIIGVENFELLQDKILDQVILNFKPDGNDIFLEEADLAIVEGGTGIKAGSFPGMRKLSKAEEALLSRSLHKREQRLAAIQKAREEKEKLIRERLEAFEEVKAQKTKVEFTLELAEKSRRVTDSVISNVLITDEEALRNDRRLISMGMYDTFVRDTDLSAYLKKWHAALILAGRSVEDHRFRDGQRWVEAQPHGSDQHVLVFLQLFLVNSGLLQPEAISGIFGYETLSAVRQFQEYNYAGGAYKLVPDGLLGKQTWEAVFHWKTEGITSDYNSFSNIFPSDEYNQWLDLLEKVKAHKNNHINAVNWQINQLEHTGDTRKVADWSTAREDIHLLCIRRNEQVPGEGRPPDDLFVLLIKGQVFIFWGSTDPNTKMAGRKDEAYLAEGQHQFQFGWFKLYDEERSYRDIRPKKEGVVIFRDKDDDDRLTDKDILSGPDPELNITITIGWSGSGRMNWSGGSLVIAGRSYRNHRDEIIDCAPYAASTRRDLQSGKTMGAYNSLLDLITILSNTPDPDIIVTLINERDLVLSGAIPDDYANIILERLQDIG